MKKINKKLLVHLHLYYLEQVDFMLKKLRNITGCDWDLYVTLCNSDNNVINKIKTFKPDAQIILVGNKGYDVLPFLKVLRTCNLADYDYILKLHTKNKIMAHVQYNNIVYKNYLWRDKLINALLKSKKCFKDNLKILEKRQDVGIIADKDLVFELTKYAGEIPEDTYLLEELKQRLNIKNNYKFFVAGTMFIARAEIFEKLVKSNISEYDFDSKSESLTSGSMAHLLERIMGILANEKGYIIYPKTDIFFKIFYYIRTKLIKNIFSITNSEDKKHKIVRVFGLKFSCKKKLKFPKGTKVIKFISKKSSINYIYKTAVIFAMYSSNGLIESSTIDYLKELKKYSDYMVVIGDCPIFESEIKKIQPYINSYVFKKHGEYDFGSYKRGFSILKSEKVLSKIDNLVFANDSVDYLGESLKDFFEQMKLHDFFGLTLNNYGYSKDLKSYIPAPHLQSFLITISSNIFKERFFSNFLNSVKKERVKEKIIYKYEMGLSRIILENGFKKYSYYVPLKDSVAMDPCLYYLNNNSNYSGRKLFIKKYLYKNPISFQYDVDNQ